MMDFTGAAEELMALQAALHRLPMNAEISRMASGELFVLYHLLTHDGQASPKELSREMMVSTARVAALLNNMESKSLVRRFPDPADSRKVIVALTEEGRELVERGRARVLSMLSRVLESIGPEDTLELIRIQKKLLECLAPRNC